MATIKSFTDISQSKKLAEILPPKSADMCYRIVAYNSNDAHEYQPYCFVGTLESDIPCWSLAALLDQLEDTIYDEDGNAYELVIKKEGVQYDIYYLDVYGEQENIELDRFYDNLIDCCYEMILKLKEKELI